MKENFFRGMINAAVAGAAAYFQELALPVVVLFLVMVVDYISDRGGTRGGADKMTTAEREKYIWDRLAAAGMTPAGAAKLMGNLYAESGLDPCNLENTYEKKLGLTDAAYTAAVDAGTYTNFARDSAGYGLAQWTYWSRKEALLSYVKAAGRSVGDLEAQLGFLLQELAGEL